MVERTPPEDVGLLQVSLNSPPWTAEEEIGYVLAAGTDAVRIGDKQKQYCTDNSFERRSWNRA